MQPTYFQLFGFEVFIEPTSYSAFSCIKELTGVGVERETQIVKVKVLVSRVSHTSPSRVLLEVY